jgi:PAS domain S-box-containing protein
MTAFVASTFAIVAAATVSAGEPRRILIFHTFGREFAPFYQVSGDFRVEFAKRFSEPYVLMDASLEMARFDGTNREDPLIDFLKEIHRDQPPHLVVPVGAQAAAFCVRHRESLFPDSPLLMVGIDERRFGGLAGTRDSVMLGVRLKLGGYMENVLRLLPETKNVHLVVGSSPFEKFWEKELLAEWQRFEGRVRLHPLSGHSVAQICELVKSLPEHSVVFYAVMNMDAAGVPHERESALKAIHAASNSPVFGPLPSQLGNGIVGGPFFPGELLADEGGAAAAKILNGTPASAIPLTVLDETSPTYDWRELRRWKIPESRLPAGSVVLFRDPSVWEAHRIAAILTLALIGLLTTLIASLLSARRSTREAMTSLSLAADAAEIGLWRRKSKSKKIVSNSRWRKIFGLPEEGELTKDDVLSCLLPEDRVKMTQAFARSAKEKKPFAFEHRVVRADGTVRWVASHGHSEPGGNGSDYGTTGASLDITEQREATAAAALQREELAHLSRISTLGVLSGSLAHELNQPLGIILSNAEAAQFLLESDHPDLEVLSAILADIVSEDRRAGEVITRLRALLRRGETIPMPQDVNECVLEVLKLCRSELIGRGVLVETNLAEDLAPGLIDRVHLQQVLLNLITNACDAMAGNPPGERPLLLETSLVGNEVRIAVRDRGIGLPDDHEHLFEPFRTTKSHGLGMGLAICRTLITSHDGTLWAEPNPDHGTTFFVALPKANA